MMPTRPMTDLVVRSTGFTLAALEACFATMFGFGYAGQLPERCPRLGVGQRKIHLHDLLVVSVPLAYHDSHRPLPWLPPPPTPPHTAFHHPHHHHPSRPTPYLAPLL